MVKLSYNEASLIDSLAKLPRRARVAFAALCAERQLQNYERYVARTGRGDASTLKEALALVWQALGSDSIGVRRLETALGRCLGLLPDEELQDDPYSAEDAVASVAYSLSTELSGSPQEAAWAARRAYEAIDHFLMLRIDQTFFDRHTEEMVASHPLVQAELLRQAADLKDLQSAELSESFISNLRARARRDAQHFLSAESQS